MANKMVFLSHVHEERALALILKNAIEDEFAGFVDVFVSSDGTSIPAGSNFLKQIEEGLANCVAALYLISPRSVKRPWINFELGAVWLRSLISERAGEPYIPAIPICHSGMSPGALPPPLGNLNGITASHLGQLEGAFRNLQTAMGGRGKLRTDFDDLAAKVVGLEEAYTVGADLRACLRATFDGDVSKIQRFVQACKECLQAGYASYVPTINSVRQTAVDLWMTSIKGALDNKVSMRVLSAEISMGPSGSANMSDIELSFNPKLVVDHAAEIVS